VLSGGYWHSRATSQTQPFHSNQANRIKPLSIDCPNSPHRVGFRCHASRRQAQPQHYFVTAGKIPAPRPAVFQGPVLDTLSCAATHCRGNSDRVRLGNAPGFHSHGGAGVGAHWFDLGDWLNPLAPAPMASAHDLPHLRGAWTIQERRMGSPLSLSEVRTHGHHGRQLPIRWRLGIRRETRLSVGRQSAMTEHAELCGAIWRLDQSRHGSVPLARL
jgi:hypothetical protein